MEVSKQLDYQKINLSYPMYKLSRLLPLSGSQTATISVSGGNEVLIELPSKCFNLSKSYLSFDLAHPALALNFNIMTSDTVAPLRQVQLYTRSGLYLCDLNEASNYIQVVYKPETKINDLIENDIPSNNSLTPAGSFEGSYASNNLTTDDFSRRRGNAGNSSINYIEPAYFLRGSVINSVRPVVAFRIPLHVLKNTIFSLDKDLLFDEVLIMRVVFNGTGKISFVATSTSDLTAGAAAVGDIFLSNIQLMLAVEQNQEIINGIREKKMSAEGLQILFDYVYTNKISLSGTSQSVSLRYNRGHGLKLKKIYHSVYNATETLGDMYNHDNTSASKITEFYTMLDNQRNQEITLRCAQTEDYQFLKQYLRGSCILNSNVYNYNWFWLEDFTHPSNMLEDDKKESNYMEGLDLNVEKKWDFFATTSNNNYNHYSFSVCQKMLVVSNSGVQIM